MTEYTEYTFPADYDKWNTYSINLPKQSNWTCYLFGNHPGGMGMVYTPVEGQVPNRFVRFMMRICLGCTWVKKDTP
jgi:hypothetical protein